LREYLEDEIRYSRTMLSGVGIVTGLNLKKFDGTTIVLTPGYGITTDGYLLDLPCALGDANEEIAYTRFQPYYDPMLPEYNFGKSLTDSNWDETGASAINTQAKLFQKNPLPDPTMFELFTATKTKYDKDAYDIKDFNAKTKLKTDDMAVVLFGEFDDQDLKNCTGTNCDNKGKKRVVAMRILLVPYAKLTRYETLKLLTVPDALSFLNVPRLSGNDLVGMQDMTTLKNAYQNKIIASHVPLLKSKIELAHSTYNYLLALTDKNYTLKDNLTTLTSDYIQYSADLLSDVTQTFNEFADEAYKFLRSCGSFIQDPFPRHLTIGTLKPDLTKDCDQYRTVFFNVPPFDQQDHHLQSARMLFEKMLLLIGNFKDESNQPHTAEHIKITPDGSAQELFIERSVP
ncbi:MAG TPA: hypothetical protein VFJ43_17450, partial [Bacteroidia bacterium]|nr:hypothetical protein [Bacteroidia bacterium]